MTGSRRGGIQAAGLFTCALAGLLLLACNPIERHRVISTIFDGVPPYVSPEERARLAAEAEIVPVVAAALEPSRKPVPKLSRFVHGPYAAKECGRCHDLGAASGFRGPGGGGALSQQGTEDMAEGGRLVMPPSELCVSCHQEYSRAAPANEGLSLHGPVGAGWCVMCHQSHASYLPRLIRREPVARLCSSCHSRTDLVANTAEHRPEQGEAAFPPFPLEGDEDAEPHARVVADCTRCHDPHRGSDRLLLRERYVREHELRAGDQSPDPALP